MLANKQQVNKNARNGRYETLNVAYKQRLVTLLVTSLYVTPVRDYYYSFWMKKV